MSFARLPSRASTLNLSSVAQTGARCPSSQLSVLSFPTSDGRERSSHAVVRGPPRCRWKKSRMNGGSSATERPGRL